ncbi:MAG: acetylxylan esterase [Treponema sp.]|jgi:cephalosporin-C deacetylase|nr:acetylxylan esterase [Treponema sp.]
MLIDLPIPELFTYGGRNPRPADHDAYWDRAMGELDALDLRPELIPAEFSPAFAQCFDLWFTGVGGVRIHARYVRPRNLTGKIPAVLKFHGYSGSAGDWFGLLPYAAAGMAIAAMDVRGQGGLSEDLGGVKGNTLHGHIIRGLDDGPDKLLFRNIFLDTAALAKVLAGFKDIDGSRMGAFGGSQGGGLTAACAALYPGLKRAAAIHPFLCDYRRVWEMDLAKGAYQELRDYFRHFDPRHEREDLIFTTLGYVDLQFLAPRIKADVLLLTGLMDTTCPPSSQFAMYNKITARKDVKLYPDFDHENLPDAGDLVFNFLMKL